MQCCRVAGGLARRGAARPARRGLSSEATPSPEPGEHARRDAASLWAAQAASGSGSGARWREAIGLLRRLRFSIIQRGPYYTHIEVTVLLSLQE